MISVCVSPSNNKTETHQTSIVPQGRAYRFIPASNMSVRVLSFGRTKCVYLVIMAGISASQWWERKATELFHCQSILASGDGGLNMTVPTTLKWLLVALRFFDYEIQGFPSCDTPVMCGTVSRTHISLLTFSSHPRWLIPNSLGGLDTHLHPFVFCFFLLIKSFPALWRKIYELSQCVCAKLALLCLRRFDGVPIHVSHCLRCYRCLKFPLED